MHPIVRGVKPLANFELELLFDNGEKRVFDVKPYLDKGIFRELKDAALFQKVRVCFDTIEWDNEADFDPEILYQESNAI
jgi:hypothetical protein